MKARTGTGTSAICALISGRQREDEALPRKKNAFLWLTCHQPTILNKPRGKDPKEEERP